MSTLAIRQIAEALGVDRSTAKRRAARERWPYEETTGRGGRRHLYPLARLPEAVQAAVMRRYPELAAPAAEVAHTDQPHAYDPEELARWAERRPEHLRAEGRRRAEILGRVMHLAAQGISIRRAAEIVAAHESDSAATILRWYYGGAGQPGAQAYRRCDWALALIPRYQGRNSSAECSPEAWDYWLADYLRPERPTAAACYRRLQRMGQIAVSTDDLAVLPRALLAGEWREEGDTDTGMPAILHEYEQDGVRYLMVWEVRRRRRMVTLKSMRKRPAPGALRP